MGGFGGGGPSAVSGRAYLVHVRGLLARGFREFPCLDVEWRLIFWGGG